MLEKQFLQSHPLFGAVNDAALEAIIPLLNHESFAAGESIIREDENGDRLYFIVSGRVEVLKKTAAGQEKRLAVLDVGDTFGEMELIDIQRRSASVKALAPVETVTLSHGAMDTIYHRDLETFTIVIMNIAREISRRLRNMDALLGSAVFTDSSPHHRNTDTPAKQRL